MERYRFFGAAMKLQSYLNILYVLLSFPLGIFYFVFLVLGFSIGLGLSVVLIGIPLVVLMFAVSWGFVIVERQLAIWMLKADIAPMSPHPDTHEDVWEQMKGHLANPVTWKGLLFLFLKFPIGLISFVIAASLLMISLSMMISPFIWLINPARDVYLGMFWINSFVSAVLVLFLGLVSGLVSLHIMNGLAFVSSIFARSLLGSERFLEQKQDPQTISVEPAAADARPTETKISTKKTDASKDQTIPKKTTQKRSALSKTIMPVPAKPTKKKAKIRKKTVRKAKKKTDAKAGKKAKVIRKTDKKIPKKAADKKLPQKMPGKAQKAKARR